MDKINGMNQGMHVDLRRENWKTIAEELDKVGITIEEESINEIVEGIQAPIDRIFMRIERYVKILASAEFLEFKELKPEDLEPEREEESIVMPQITDVDISELIDLRMNTMALNASREKQGPSFLPPGIHIPQADNPAQAHSVDLDNELLASKESSPNRKSPNVRESTKSVAPVMQEEPEIQQTPKKVKDGVDILKIDADKPLGDCESSLELILITLSKAFNMKPK